MENSLVLQNKISEINFENLDITDLPFKMSSLNISVENSTHTIQSDNSPTIGSNISSSEEDFQSPSSSIRRSQRRSYSNALHKINRRVISKPKKFIPSFTNEKEIHKFYTNKKLSNYKPTNLETIFEETSDTAAVCSSTTNFIGARKYKRSKSLTKECTVTKSIIQNRRKRIKRLFGRNLNLVKISMDDFLSHFNSLHDANETHSDIECSTSETVLDDNIIIAKSSNEI